MRLRSRNTACGTIAFGVKGLISGARIFIGNDSGPAHIAAAFGVPWWYCSALESRGVGAVADHARVLTSLAGHRKITIDQC